METSREYIRREREDKVDILAAADSDDQYHHVFFKYSVLIMSSNATTAWTIWEKGMTRKMTIDFMYRLYKRNIHTDAQARWRLTHLYFHFSDLSRKTRARKSTYRRWEISVTNVSLDIYILQETSFASEMFSFNINKQASYLHYITLLIQNILVIHNYPKKI